MEHYRFIDNSETFSIKNPENYSGLYFPIAGDHGMKSAVTPNLAGDSKLDQNTFFMEPASIEDLHNRRSTRNFWCRLRSGEFWSATGVSARQESQKFTKDQDESELTAGFMWQTVTRCSKEYPMEASVTSFVPLKYSNVEIMHVAIKNTGDQAVTVTPTAAVPIYGRSADNIRDHRHVTSLLHRIKTTNYGVAVTPSLSFDERGHQRNEMTYFVLGVTGDGKQPVDFYPCVEDYLGEGGMYTNPEAIRTNMTGVAAGAALEGKEALGGIHFAEVTLQPKETMTYTILMGVSQNGVAEDEFIQAFGTEELVQKALEEIKEYWKNQVNVWYHTGDVNLDQTLRWISFQPMLRRIYGCSFLPHHDYGKGGRGFRDLWQDCLALLIMDPSEVRKMLLSNFAGVRMDGTNATIIGSKPGEFLADRNHITRVWMDHGVWPWLTTQLYINQTGDLNILLEDVNYFKDQQVNRGYSRDEQWTESYGNWQREENGDIYQGTVLEHLLLQHLCAFYEVGEHNHIKLRDADWNDALDMAKHHGESVAFTCAYAGNMKGIAHILKVMKETGIEKVSIAKEMEILLRDDAALYEQPEDKLQLLRQYTQNCEHKISGEKVEISLEELADNLTRKAEWMMEHIRKTEWISDNKGNSWFNGYYDDQKRRVEGVFESGVRMMLTGQVFAVMSGTALEEQVKAITKSADEYLYLREAGGYRLNTNFHEMKFDLGRMFGFAYGEKENGAVFSHMTVMYANALYQRGFVKEGYKALQTLLDTAMNFETSYIYPGIPEYFNAKGRGLYHYLTGAASWLMLTMIHEVFGVKGELGDLVVAPRLVKEQFDEAGDASIALTFAEKKIRVVLHNLEKKEYGEYQIAGASLDGKALSVGDSHKVTIPREIINGLGEEVTTIEVELR